MKIDKGDSKMVSRETKLFNQELPRFRHRGSKEYCFAARMKDDRMVWFLWWPGGDDRKPWFSVMTADEFRWEWRASNKLASETVASYEADGSLEKYGVITQ